MREAHAHIAGYGEAIAIPDLADCHGLDDCLDRVRQATAAAAGQGAFARLHGARIEAWPEARWPSLAELDAASRGPTGEPVPCVIMSFDHHAAVANSAAMMRAGLRAGQQIPPQGEVVSDAASGHATGLLIEHAAYAAWEAAPEPTAEQRLGHISAALRALAGLGFREVHDLHSQPWLGSALAELQRRGELPVSRVWLYPPVDRLIEAHARRSSWESSALRLAGGKLFADGTLNSRTALTLHPYRDPIDDASACGRAMVTPRQLDEAIRVSESLGLHLAVHAIGDGAVRMVLDAIERSASLRSAGPGNRHRIEHCELVDEADVGRFSSLGVVCSVQPCHLLTDIEVLCRQLPHRLDRVLPLRDLIDAGCAAGGEDDLLWFGSDVPIVRADPQDSVQAAVGRRRSGMTEVQAIGWSQRIREQEAWAAFALQT